MTRLSQLFNARPFLAVYVAGAVATVAGGSLAYAEIEQVNRMMNGELVSVAQAVDLDARAKEAMRDMTRFVIGLQSAEQIDDAAAFREKVQDISNELHRVHFPRSGGKSSRSPDPLAVYADQLQGKGVQLQDAIWMLKVWEWAASNGDDARAEESRSRVVDILMDYGVDAAALGSNSFDDSRLGSRSVASI
jgi:hypothetical protein